MASVGNYKCDNPRCLCGSGRNTWDEALATSLNQPPKHILIGYEEAPMFKDSPFNSEKKEKSVSSDVEYAIDKAVEDELVKRETAKRLAAIDSYGEDNYPVGTVLKFEKKLKNIDEPVEAVAFKVNDVTWRVVGGSTNAVHTWDEFRMYLAKPVAVTKLTVGKFE